MLCFFAVLVLDIRPVLFQVAHYSLSSLFNIFWIGVFGVLLFACWFFFANLSKRLNTVGIDGEVFLYIYMMLFFISFFVSGIIFFVLFLLSFLVVFLQEKADSDLN